MTEYKDQGLKKAAKQSKTPQLPSNFTYRMMKRIGEEMYLREKRQEKRLFILMIITVMLMTGGCLGMIIWMYGKKYPKDYMRRSTICQSLHHSFFIFRC